MVQRIPVWNMAVDTGVFVELAIKVIVCLGGIGIRKVTGVGDDEVATGKLGVADLRFAWQGGCGFKGG